MQHLRLRKREISDAVLKRFPFKMPCEATQQNHVNEYFYVYILVYEKMYKKTHENGNIIFKPTHPDSPSFRTETSPVSVKNKVHVSLVAFLLSALCLFYVFQPFFREFRCFLVYILRFRLSLFLEVYRLRPVMRCDWLACDTWLRNAQTCICQFITIGDRFSSLFRVRVRVGSSLG